MYAVLFAFTSDLLKIQISRNHQITMWYVFVCLKGKMSRWSELVQKIPHVFGRQRFVFVKKRPLTWLIQEWGVPIHGPGNSRHFSEKFHHWLGLVGFGSPRKGLE